MAESETPYPPSLEFRTLTALPTSLDIRMFISSKSSTLTEDKVYSIAGYLSDQFHLFREDLIQTFGGGVVEYLGRSKEVDDVIKLSRCYLYRTIAIIDEPCFINTSLCCHLKVTVKQYLNMNTPERLLQGNLVCITDTNFQTFAFARILSQKIVKKKTWKLEVRVESSSIVDLQLESLILLEADDDYGCYVDVLSGLQKIDINTPLIKRTVELLNLHHSDEDELVSIFHSSESEDEEQPQSLPCEKNYLHVALDRCQAEAFKFALSQKISLICGPPGSGKTYLCIKLLQYFLDSDLGSPILVVCHSDDTLENILERLLKLTERVVRVGGSSKSTAVEGHTLSVMQSSLRKYRNVQEIVRPKMESIDNEKNFSQDLDTVHIASVMIAKKIIGNDLPEDNTGEYQSALDEIEQEIVSCQMALQSLVECNFTEKILDMMIPHSSVLRNADMSLMAALKWWLGLMPSKINMYNYIPELLLTIPKIERKVMRHHFDVSKSSPRKLSNDIAVQKGKSELSTQELEELCRLITVCLLDCEESALNDMKGKMNAILFDKWHLCRQWREKLRSRLRDGIDCLKLMYLERLNSLNKAQQKYNCQFLCGAEGKVVFPLVVGMTSKEISENFDFIQKLDPKVTIVEEATEIPEAEVILSLTPRTESLILIADSTRFVAKSSLKNSMSCQPFNSASNFLPSIPRKYLKYQHRMRSTITRLVVPHFPFWGYPQYDDVRGMAKSVFFMNEQLTDDSNISTKGDFLIEFACYLIHREYDPSEITILVTSSAMFKYLVQKADMASLSVNVATMSSFKRREQDIILMSLNGNSVQNTIQFLNSTQGKDLISYMSLAKQGLYCFGDSKFLSKKSPLCKSIIEKFQQHGIIGDGLPLRCEDNPTKVLCVSNAKDFPKEELS